MTVSVALCAYNGAAYLPDQLESIAAQSRPPDELVVRDDASLDDTPAVVRAFAARAPFPVRLEVSARRLGSTRNFDRAIAACAGDIIALSDQDDVWHPDKLRAIERRFHESPGVGLVFSDADIVDAALNPTGARLWARIGFDGRRQRVWHTRGALTALVPGRTVTGATMAFRSTFRALVLPTPDGIAPMIHDGWIALAIAAVAGVAFLEQPLLAYRQHGTQQLGAQEAFDGHARLGVRASARHVNAYSMHIASLGALRERLAAGRAGPEGVRTARRVGTILRHFDTRAHLPSRRLTRLPLVLRELFTRRYHDYGNGWRSAVKDLVS
ncbi:MAG TPA: glycosyltransferase family 2 protein [Vicinamibacterales bacterium]